MKALFFKYKLFILFLIKFLGSYLILLTLYNFYLLSFDVAKYETDSFTVLVAKQTKIVLDVFNFNVSLENHLEEASVRVLIDNAPIVRIVEGCNALSIMILFVAFIIAFSGKWLQTVLFILFGLLVIHILNVLRIAILIVGMLKFRQYENFMHDVIFPLFIYGVVFGLWIFWVNKFSKYAK